MLGRSAPLVLVLFAATPVLARTIVVSPGPGAIQNAIAAASPGDTIKLTPGIYAEAVTIDKRLTLRGPKGYGTVGELTRIDTGCTAPTALTIAADDVRIERVDILGGTLFTVDISGRSKVRIRDIETLEGHFGCGAVEHGINVYDSTRVRIEKSFVIGDNNGYTGTYGYRNAGIYIGGIPVGGDVRVKQTVVVGSSRGIIVEDSAGAPTGPLVVRVEKSLFTSNDTGIFLHSSDRVGIERNTVNDSRGSTPTVSIEVDGTSDENVIRRNMFMDAALDVIDAGSSNCWQANTVETGAVPSGGCD